MHRQARNKCCVYLCIRLTSPSVFSSCLVYILLMLVPLSCITAAWDSAQLLPGDKQLNYSEIMLFLKEKEKCKQDKMPLFFIVRSLSHCVPSLFKSSLS